MNKFLVVLLLLVSASSCISYEKLVNFNEGPEFPTVPQPSDTLPEPVIQPYDALAINITALDPVLAAPFNLTTGTAVNTGGTYGDPTGANYQVDAKGNIEIPLVGTVNVGKVTVVEAKKRIEAQLIPYLKNPFVTVRRFSQFRFTVLGEVTRPSTFTVPEDRVTVLQALGLAGDLTNYANRENVLIARNANGKKEYGRINLRDRNVFESPYFFLQRDDVVYVEPVKEKVGAVASQANKVLPFVTAGVTLINLIVIITRR